jgi:dipeptidyl aminopeptidase/acylaminoacyl peptidase
MVLMASDEELSAQAARKPTARERTVRVAGIVLRWVRADKETNYRRIEPLIREAAANGARVVCTTECFLDGHARADKNLSIETARALGEEIPAGTYFKRLAALAGELKIHLVAGMIEADGPSRYNAAVLIGPDGKLIAKRRQGGKCVVFDTPFGKAGIPVGGERTRAAVVSRFVENGADFLLSPSGSWGSFEDILLAQARSRESKIHIASVHPQAFFVTGPEGTTRKREILGNVALLKPAQIDGEEDENGVCYFDLPIRPKSAATEIDKAVFEPMVGQALYYRSRIYGDLQPLAVCATDVSRKPKPLIVQLMSVAFPKDAARNCQAVCRLAKDRGLDCVVLAADGRGGGSVHQGYGEVDVYEAIAAVKKKLAIDPDRITVTGASVGGAAAWYHASHYPDFWAGAAPLFGYCDDKIWEKSSLSFFRSQPWEEFSWTARSAAYRAANMRHVALYIAHGEWDRGVPGGVPVEHSRQMDRLLSQLGIPHTYIEIPKTGHYSSPEVVNTSLLWLLKQKRVTDPDRVSLVVHTLRHHRAHWVAVHQQIVYGKPSTVEARRHADSAIDVKTTNVRRLSLGPVAKGTKLDLDGTAFPKVDLTTEQHFTRLPAGSWARAEGPILTGEKRPGLSGPFADLFVAPTIIVHGQSGSAEAGDFNRVVAESIPRHFSQWNGGVHRGSIPGNSNVMLPIVSDRRFLELLAEPADAEPVDLDTRYAGDHAKVGLAREVLHRANLFLIGDAASNSALAKLAPRLPVRIEKDKLTLGGKTYHGRHLAFFAIFPHPDGKRYVALLAGNQPDSICWGSRVGLQLLPDYLVFNHDRIVDWGFGDNNWRHTDVNPKKRRPAPRH